MATVLLGSESPKAPAEGTQTSVNGEEVKSDESVQLPARTIVLIDTPDVDLEGNKVPLDKKLMEIRTAFALHSDAPAKWVEGVNEGFTAAVSQVFDCPVGRPDNWDEEQEQPVQQAEPEQTEAPKAETVSEVQVEGNIEGDEGVMTYSH